MIGTFARNEGGFKLIVEETEKWGKVVPAVRFLRHAHAPLDRTRRQA
jgi:hypothetical protein